MPGKMFGCQSLATLLLLVAAVMAILGWSFEATGTTVLYGRGAPTLTGLSVFFEIPLLLVVLVIILWVLSRRNRNR